MQIKYSPDADTLVIKLREGNLIDSVDISEGIILHLSEGNKPCEIEVLDASKVVDLQDVNISWPDMTSIKQTVRV